MGRRAARAFAGAGLAACALLASRELAAPTPSAGAAEPAPTVVEGAVLGNGVPALPGDPPGWIVGHPKDGSYLVVVEGGGDDLTVTSWDPVASVSVTPLGGGISVVEFSTHEGEPVDAPFSFRATLPTR